ncbi:MAG: hypothetical protein KDE31_25965, partial [Caldilineaceae bacterium]|nr:hypothetical protein [Caldilineaceae bacterium]
MSVQSVPGKASYYRFKSWRTSEVEPKSWDMEGYGRIGEPTNGSLMLVAHHVDATFGDVTVRPLSAITPRIDVDTDGNGAVILSPDKEEYAYGEEVELLATGNSGFAFDAWSGDVSSTQNSLKLFVTQDISLTANFIMPSPSTLQTSTPGGGQIKISPQKASYAFDELVSITAIPNAGQQFLGWSGSTTSLQNPLTFKIRSNTNLIATFGPAAPPISDDFNSCRLDPDLWTVRDPKADSTLELNGTQLLISVPANSDHNLFEEKNFAPRILQELPDQDFIVEAKFDSLPSLRYQTQGIVIEEDVDNFVRMEYYHNGTNVIMYAAASVDAQVTAYASRAITVPVGTTSLYMRVTRTDDSWTQERSFDGVLWETNITFDHALTVNRGGVYGGNADPKTDA